MENLQDRIYQIGIVPVVKVLEESDALPLAKALYQGGIDVAEITFRSEHAVSAIKTIRKELPDMLVGAGTVLTLQQCKDAIEAGAQFIVTPGCNPEILDYCVKNQIEIYPGVSSGTEIELALSYGLTTLKFFPAESSGGARKLKDFQGPYSQVKFIPTGGINPTNMHDYLSLNNVVAIGGSFMLPNDLVVNKDWDGIEALVKKAMKNLLNIQLIHVGINTENQEEAHKVAHTLCDVFGFTYYGKPKSDFAGVGFEIMHKQGRGENGHIGLYTPYPERALYQLNKKGIHAIEETITRNKKSHRINFAYIDFEIAGFAFHLINPDLKMEV